MSKFFGFLLGVVVALVGPAVFGVLAADGGIELNAKEMALAYGIGALIFWAVVSYFSGAAAIGAALVFGAMIYTVHWIPNRMTNFLNDVPGVTTGMIEGVKQYTLNGVVPILAIISLVYGIQLIVRSAQRRRRERAEAERVQREQELAQAQQAAAVAPYAPAAYPVAGGDYQPPAENRFTGNTSYEDLFDDEVEPEPVQPRNQADEQTALYPTSAAEHEAYDDHPDTDDDTRLVPTDADATVMVPTATAEDDSPTQAADEDTVQAETPAAQEEAAAEEQTVAEPVAQGDGPSDDDTQYMPPPPASSPPAGTAAPATPVTQEAQASTPPAPATPAPEAQASPAAPTQEAQAPAAPTPVAPTQQAQADPVETTQGAQTDPAAETQPVPAEPVLEETQPIAVAQTPEKQTSSGDASTGNAPSSTPSAGAGSAPETDGSSSTGGSKVEGSGGTAQAAASPVGTAGPAYGVRGDESVGQQYRERMEGPEADETGEHHFGAFENPVRVDESVPQAPRVMDMPGQFRPAGT